MKYRHEGSENEVDAAPSYLNGLLRGLAHALTNRLAGIRAVEGLMAGDSVQPALLKSVLAREADALERVTRLVGLLGRGEGESDEPIDLRTFLEEVVDLHRFHDDFEDLGYELSGIEGVPPGRAVPSRLRHLLLERLSDAAERTARKGGTVVVRCREDGNVVRIEMFPDDRQAAAASPVRVHKLAGLRAAT